MVVFWTLSVGYYFTNFPTSSPVHLHCPRQKLAPPQSEFGSAGSLSTLFQALYQKLENKISSFFTRCKILGCGGDWYPVDLNLRNVIKQKNLINILHFKYFSKSQSRKKLIIIFEEIHDGLFLFFFFSLSKLFEQGKKLT